MDLSPLEFSVSTPGTDEEIAGQVAHALSLGLPEADASAKRLHIVANGPTAKAFFSERPEGDSMALNGALGLFVERGLGPTYWAACDPQALVTGFLDFAPVYTTYLVASQCHPSVFERLKHHDVRLWHLDGADLPGKRLIPPASSVTLTSMLLAQRLGYRRLDMWGWDCCFAEDGSHHAGKGELGRTSDSVEVKVDGVDEPYHSTATWGCEVNDAIGVLPVLKWCGIEVAIHGRSFVSAVLHEFKA